MKTMHVTRTNWAVVGVAMGSLTLGCGSSSTSTYASPDAAKADSAINAQYDSARFDAVLDAVQDGAVSAAVARGEYLVNHVIACSDCHTPKLPNGAPDSTKYMAGNANFVVSPNGDRLPTRNLTPDPTGLGGFSATQIERAFLDGIAPAPTGTMALNSVMPYYVFHNMNAADANAIAAYLGSLPAVANALPDRSPSFDVAAPATYLDPSTIPTPAASDIAYSSAIRGRYLATETGLCIECHTKHLATGPMPLDITRFFQGGEDFGSFFVGTVNIHPVSLNLTSDPTTGLGDWTPGDIVTELKTGIDKDGNGICPPMPVGPLGAYGGLTDGDALDIANYIKSLPPAVNYIVDMCTFPPPPPSDAGTSDGETDAGDAGCVENVLCVTSAHWDHALCRCVDNGDGGSTDASAVACCPSGWLMYSCTFPDGGQGLACHNPALGCASALVCGAGCDPVVAGQCSS
jgi:mono/diheme cytochrome c family protein